MELLAILVVAFVGFVILRAYGSAPTRGGRGRDSGGGASVPKLPAWLVQRWELAASGRDATGRLFPEWYFDPMTERQASRLKEEGRSFSASMTKGQASDLIGLNEPAREADLEVLRFFCQPLRGMNETRARHEVALLFRDEANRRAWEDRPVTPRQKEFFRFFGMKPDAGLLKRDADQQMSARLDQAIEAHDPRADHWDAYESILDEFEDREFRESVGIKKPSVAQIRKAIDALLANGRSWEELDADELAEYLLEVQPSLAR